MSFRGNQFILRAGLRTGFGFGALAGAAFIASVALSSPASAGFFDRLFSGLRHAFEAPRPPNFQPYGDPATDGRMAESDSGPASGYCVRSCDGRYFPVRAQPGLSAADACHSFCPASQTRLYSGSSIDTSIATNGSRYADLPNAYLYRKEVVGGCTCNGHDAFGLARIDASTDPTLRPGDIVATRNGLAAYTGGNGQAAAFTPVASYAGLPKSDRNKLSGMRISRTAPVVRATTPSAGREPDDRNAQLEK
jgi:Protein of unknown function (DUF2865)